MLKSVTMVLVEHASGVRPFLVSDDDIEVGDTVCEITASGAWFLATIQTSNDLSIAKQKKIVATPEQIGYLVYRENKTSDLHHPASFTSTRELGPRDIDLILERNGECAIEMETYEGDYCGFRIVKYNDEKVLIHLKDAHIK